MMKLVLAALLMTAGFACKHNSYKHTAATENRTYERNTASDDRDRSRDDDNYKDVDNTAMNKRDADGKTLTAGDQYRGSEADLATTAKVRRAVTDDDSLSVKAQNIKIITLKGITTLRGPVETISEKTQVEKLARRAGARNINNELEVTSKTE